MDIQSGNQVLRSQEMEARHQRGAQEAPALYWFLGCLEEQHEVASSPAAYGLDLHVLPRPHALMEAGLQVAGSSGHECALGG